MINLIDIVVLLGCSAIAIVAMLLTFKWGYEKEKNGKRTDWLGRPNNHLKDMD